MVVSRGRTVFVDTALDSKTTPLYAESSCHFLESITSSLAALLSGREGCQQEFSNCTLLHVHADFIVSPFRHRNVSSLFPVSHSTFIFTYSNPLLNRGMESFCDEAAEAGAAGAGA